MTARLEDWPQRLDAAINAARSLPLGYDTGHDCCLFTSRLIEAMTGIDVAASFRGKYVDRRGALMAMRDFSGAGLSETASMIASQHGWPEIPRSYVKRGDVVLFISAEGPSLGVCVGSRLVTADVSGGITFVPMTESVTIWSVW